MTPAWQQPPAPAPAPEAAASQSSETTVMPAWQPPAPVPAVPATPAPEAPGGVSDTVVMGGPAPAAAAPADSGAQGEVKIDSGPDTGHTFQIGTQPLRVGRAPDNELILRDPATSGHHARLERRSAQFFILDLGSTNGTLVNGEPVQEKELKHGDRITIGQNSLVFSLL